MIRPKHLVFAVIFVVMGYVLAHNERFLVEPENPVWGHYSKYVPVADVINEAHELRRPATVPLRSPSRADAPAVAAPLA